MRAILAGALAIFSTPAVAQKIQVPFFEKLKVSDVCGGASPYCVPTSSLNYDRVNGADFNGDLQDWLGTHYKNRNGALFNRESCYSDFSVEKDVSTAGLHNFFAIVDNRYAGNINSKLGIDLNKFLGGILSILPIPVGIKLKADATDKLTNSSAKNIGFVYKRIDLKLPAITKMMQVCRPVTGGTDRVVTGISIITVSGEWSYGKIVDAFGEFEASGEFLGLSPDIKSKYTDERNKALSGKFEPLTMVIGVAYRQ